MESWPNPVTSQGVGDWGTTISPSPVSVLTVADAQSTEFRNDASGSVPHVWVLPDAYSPSSWHSSTICLFGSLLPLPPSMALYIIPNLKSPI